MSFLKNMKLLGPLLSVVIVGTAIGGSLSGYELPHYEVEAQAAEVADDRPVPDTPQDETEIGVGSWELDDGVYRGRGVGYSGEILVDVTIADKTITQIDIVKTQDDAAYLNMAKEGVISAILSTQSLDVDTVSGATYSSNGIIKAVRNALTGEEDTSTVEKKGEGQGSTNLTDAEDPGAYRDGVYYGTGTGFGGTMKVKVVIENGKIASIDVVSHKDDASFFNRAVTLLKKIIEKQSTNVDTVSGATYSSVGLINAVRDALRQAAVNATEEEPPITGTEQPTSQREEPEDVERIEEPSAYKDGVYYGKGTGFGGEMELKVTVVGGKIVSVEVVSCKDDEEYFSKAKVLFRHIIDAQSTNVDTISGATYSSVGIIQAVRDALRQAATDPSTVETDPENRDEDDTVAIPTGRIPYLDGTYSGTGEGWGGDITVTITIKDQTMTDIVVDSHEDETEEFYQRAVSVIDRMLRNQSTDVNAVSGATFSSEGIMAAVQDALDAAKEATDAAKHSDEDPDSEQEDSTATDPVDPSGGSDDSDTDPDDPSGESDDPDTDPDDTQKEEKTYLYSNGTFTGSARCVDDSEDEEFDYSLGLSVTIENDRITDISGVTENGTAYTSGTDNATYIKRAYQGTKSKKGLMAQILEWDLSSGDRSYDVVTNATYSSRSIYEAVMDALGKAKK